MKTAISVVCYALFFAGLGAIIITMLSLLTHIIWRSMWHLLTH